MNPLLTPHSQQEGVQVKQNLLLIGPCYPP